MKISSTHQSQLAEMQLADKGCCLLKGYVPEESLRWACREMDDVLQSKSQGVLTSDGIPYGVRNLLQLWPNASRLVSETEAGDFVGQILDSKARLVRGLLFDKPPGKSWTLPWHRDRTIAVQEHVPDAAKHGFTNPTKKAGIAHYTAPVSFLEQMLTLRISLDPMVQENGPLIVIEGSHLNQGEADEDLVQPNQSTMSPVHCAAGDIFVMRPLLAHSSLMPDANCQLRRRVVHLEFSSQDLPSGLQWHWSVPLAVDSEARESGFT